MTKPGLSSLSTGRHRVSVLPSVLSVALVALIWVSTVPGGEGMKASTNRGDITPTAKGGAEPPNEAVPQASASGSVESAPPGATLVVLNVVVNDTGGNRREGDFPLFVDGRRVLSGEKNTLAPGVHTVTQTPDPGYASTVGGDCSADGSITLLAGEEKICAITNDDKPARLEVVAVVGPDQRGGARGKELTLFIDGAPVESGSGLRVPAGRRRVGHSGDRAATVGGDCAADGTVTLGPGETKRCTIQP